MGQRANSGRNATLDDKKQRMQGRQQQRGPAAEPVRDAYSEKFAKGKTSGAFGKDGMANRRRNAGNATREGGGGGGGATAPDKDAAVTGTGRSSRPARKRVR
jgi:hypothetical protein